MRWDAWQQEVDTVWPAAEIAARPLEKEAVIVAAHSVSDRGGTKTVSSKPPRHSGWQHVTATLQADKHFVLCTPFSVM